MASSGCVGAEIKVDKTDCLKDIFSSTSNSKSVTLVSKFPDVCKDEACVLGVDEAGRGPVLGPMVYGICFCPLSEENELKDLGCADSKTLTEEKREAIFKILCDEKDSGIGWAVEVISPNTICNSMLRRQKKSLNQVSHDSAISLIKRALDGGINVTQVFVDTVGPADKYQDKLSEIFPQLQVTVASKADATYPIVSAASICAKVIRDFALQTWEFPECIELPDGKNWGSGYPNGKLLMRQITVQLVVIHQLPHFLNVTPQQRREELVKNIHFLSIEI
ncbi:ribonuclease H2 subunit A isoform X2 [Lycorma delicatula]|uniref:ribonuclease H2 subunit A isoform X2 n=1 Tax=Lycorma delicatula TaxID=130591 RepID=UPI003F510039